MKRKAIKVESAARDWFRNPAFTAEYEALEEEFALARALISARARSDMTQAEVAVRMGTTQAVVARLESGRAAPSTRTLRRFADATGMRLDIRFTQRREAARK